MKKIIALFTAAACLFGLSACKSATVDDIIQSQISIAETTVAQTELTAAETTSVQTELSSVISEQAEKSDVDIDLASLSGTMAYAELYNLMSDREAAVGKTIRLRGKFSAKPWEETENTYYYVVISDETACCQTGIEFILDENKHPDDYPPENTDIEITGEFKTYIELDETYYYIATDEIVIL